jgi:hypothetical protein
MIVDLGGVEARDRNGRKEDGEQRGAGLGQFVQDERAARAISARMARRPVPAERSST